MNFSNLIQGFLTYHQKIFAFDLNEFFPVYQ